MGMFKRASKQFSDSCGLYSYGTEHYGHVQACEQTVQRRVLRGAAAPCRQVMAYIVMAYIVMAYISMAYVVMAYSVMAYIGVVYMGMAYNVMACNVMAYNVMAYIGMAYIGMAYICYGLQQWVLRRAFAPYQQVMAYIVMAYIVMAAMRTSKGFRSLPTGYDPQTSAWACG